MPQRPVNVHVLGAVPLGVVGVSVPDLPDELIVRRVTSYEVICAPPESLGVPLGQPGRVIPRLSVDIWSSHHQDRSQVSYLEADAAPRQDGDGARHGESKLDKVSSIVISFRDDQYRDSPTSYLPPGTASSRSESPLQGTLQYSEYILELVTSPRRTCYPPVEDRISEPRKIGVTGPAPDQIHDIDCLPKAKKFLLPQSSHTWLLATPVGR